jgi:RNA polymerase sigma-70 factor, ECF subfamily
MEDMAFNSRTGTMPDEAALLARLQAGDAAIVRRHETRELVRQAIGKLPEIYRTVLLLREIEGLDTEETAQLLETSPGVVRTRLHRARQALRALLDPHFRGGDL